MTNRAEPLPIKESAGECIRVVLGATASRYFGVERIAGGGSGSGTHVPFWSAGIPSGFANHVNELTRLQRVIKAVSMGHRGEWFVSSVRSDGTVPSISYGGLSTPCGKKVRALWPKSNQSLQVAFGPDSSYVLVCRGSSGYSIGPSVARGTITQVQRLKAAGHDIHKVTLIRGGVHVIQASDAVHFATTVMAPSLAQELNKSEETHGRIIDVCAGGDGSWIVTRPTSFQSFGLESDLEKLLVDFYARHVARQKAREQEIKKFREDAKRLETENAKKRQRTLDDALSDITFKQLKVGLKVTVVGWSRKPGDAIVKLIDPTKGLVRVAQGRKHKDIRDLRLVLRHEALSTQVQPFLLTVTDKYEAAVAVYYCECDKNSCRCTQVYSRPNLPKSPAPYCGLIAPAPPTQIPTQVVPFNEYKCAEKIDLRRLKRVVDDLANDTDARTRMLQKLDQKNSKKHTQGIAKLRRCHRLELLAKELYNALKSYPMDRAGCVVRDVQYEHRDPSNRGRLFALGDEITLLDTKFPRTTTLQAMQSDLRATVAGSFAHDVDCENSEVRLLCSLAEQYNMKEVVQILFDYRDRRTYWLGLIANVHGVNESDAKRLPTIVINGGSYFTWLKSIELANLPNTDDKARVKSFAFNLDCQVRLLQNHLLQHPRFSWTDADRQVIEGKGKKGRIVDTMLLSRIIQSCENEVLRILQREFHAGGWIVRALIFDGLIVERGPSVRNGLAAAMRLVEQACRRQGWNVVLTEKPLFGRQDDPIQAIVDARSVLRDAAMKVR